MFNLDFSENETVNQKNLFFFSDLFFHVESPNQLYHWLTQVTQVPLTNPPISQWWYFINEGI